MPLIDLNELKQVLEEYVALEKQFESAQKILLSKIQTFTFLSVESLSPGRIRLESPFKYPDGGSIELYLFFDVCLETGKIEKIKLTDLGETLIWLFHTRTEYSKELFQDILDQNGILNEGSELYIKVSLPEELENSFVRMIQTCIRVSDLIFCRNDLLTS